MHPIRRFTRNRPRLVVAFACGLAFGLLLPFHCTWTTRVLAGWNAAVWSYLILMGWLVTRASQARVQEIAEQEDESAIAVLVILSLAATLSIVAIVFELANSKAAAPDLRLVHYAFTGLTLLGSWCLVGVLFAFHYAQGFYRSSPARRSLRFPDEEQHPDYWDFLYFSFTIAVAAQTSDVTVASHAMRKTVLAQSVLSFIFNVAILGLSINIAAGAVGN